MQEKYWFLKHCRLFDLLEPVQLQWLESRSRLRRYPKGSTVYLPADEADGVLLLAQGRVRICGLTSGGKQSILAFIEPGEIFGELALFDRGQREDYAEAAEASQVVLIPADALRKVAEESPQLALGVSRLVGLRRKRIERRLKYLLFHSNRERLVHLLLELAEDYGDAQPNGELALRVKLSHQDLASIIGSTRESVTVILGQLQAEGLLRVSRRKVVIRQRDALARTASGTALESATPPDASPGRYPSALRHAR